MLSNLFWRTKAGHNMPLKQVSVAEFRGLGPNEMGIPTVFAVWPTPGEEEVDSIMTDNQTPPDWVLLEAAKRCEWSMPIGLLREHYCTMYVFTALCDMIERYEQPPVDRKLLCAREAVLTAGDGWTRADVAVRAIELWEDGYGK